MLVLDSNHLRELAYRSPIGIALEARFLASDDEVVSTVVCAEGSLRGRMARLAAAREASEQVQAYGQLVFQIGFLAKLRLLPWDFDAAARLKTLRSQGIRIGTMDLRIACITMEYDGLLLTRNTVDFAQVPGLRFENWLR